MHFIRHNINYIVFRELIFSIKKINIKERESYNEYFSGEE